MKKLITIMLVLVMLLSLVACGANNTPAQTKEEPVTQEPAQQDQVAAEEPAKADETPAASGEKVKVVVWGLNPMQVGAGNQEMLDAFAKENPNIEIVPQTTPGTGGYATQDSTKLLAAIAGGTPPEVTYLDRFTAGEYASRNALAPLDDLISASNLDWNNFVEYSRREATFNGKVYALPWDVDTRMLFWNKDLFKKAGLDPEKAPQTWDELLDYGKKLTVSDSKGNFKTIGFIALYGNGEIYNYAYSDHQKLLSEDGKQCLMNTPGVVKAMDFVFNTYEQLGGAKKVNAYTSTFQGEANDPFLTGQVAMLVNGNWALANYARFKPDLDYGVDLIPNSTGAERGTWSGGWSWAIPNNTKHPKEAFEVIKWLTTKGFNYKAEGQAAYNKTENRPFIPNMPAYRPLDEELVTKYIDTLPDALKQKAKFARDIIQYSTCREVSPLAETSYVELKRAQDKVIYKEMDSQTALDATVKTVQEALDKFWADYKGN